MIDKINWKKVDGLVPCVIQSSQSKEILMLGYMNKEALKKTLEEKIVSFYSRTKKRLWKKGETSGNYLYLKDIRLDCDLDTLLIEVDEKGPTCHLNTPNCFNSSDLSFLESLEAIIDQRLEEDTIESYTRYLSSKGIAKIAQKVGEEAVELAIAASLENKEESIEEASDLMFHLLLLLKNLDLSLKDVSRNLSDRHYKKKASI